MEKLIKPALKDYDFIIQDRGFLSGISYGKACGNNEEFILNLNKVSAFSNINTNNTEFKNLYYFLLKCLI